MLFIVLNYNKENSKIINNNLPDWRHTYYLIDDELLLIITSITNDTKKFLQEMNTREIGYDTFGSENDCLKNKIIAQGKITYISVDYYNNKLSLFLNNNGRIDKLALRKQDLLNI